MNSADFQMGDPIGRVARRRPGAEMRSIAAAVKGKQG